MTATAHALIGGAIASSVQNPALGLTLSALSHPILDAIPHWDFGWGWRKKTKIKLFLEASFDLILGLVLAYFIFYSNPFFTNDVNLLYFFGCILASEIWDMLEVPYWFLNWRFPPFSTLYNIQHHIQGKAKLPWGILTQVATVTLFVLILRSFH